MERTFIVWTVSLFQGSIVLMKNECVYACERWTLSCWGCPLRPAARCSVAQWVRAGCVYLLRGMSTKLCWQHSRGDNVTKIRSESYFWLGGGFFLANAAVQPSCTSRFCSYSVFATDLGVLTGSRPSPDAPWSCSGFPSLRCHKSSRQRSTSNKEGACSSAQHWQSST